MTPQRRRCALSSAHTPSAACPFWLAYRRIAGQAEEAAKAAADEDALKKEAEEAERRRIKAEKKKNMTPEMKKAKTNYTMKYKKKGQTVISAPSTAPQHVQLPPVRNEPSVRAQRGMPHALLRCLRWHLADEGRGHAGG